MKCAICDAGLGGEWFSVAARYGSGQIRVFNAHRSCLERELSRPGIRKLDRVLFNQGWIQEALPLGI